MKENDENIYESINENIKDLEMVQNDIAMLEFGLYQKSVEEKKQTKIQEIIDYFDGQAKLYEQKNIKSKKEIELIVREYTKQLEKLIKAYDKVYITVFKIRQSAICNQKIAVANIITLETRKAKKGIKNKEKDKIQDIMIACAEKKLNYAVMIEECNARLKWCRENIINNIDNIFINDMCHMQVYKENFFIKIINSFMNKISGKSKYKEILENYKKGSLSNIKLNNTSKILEVMATLRGIEKQMDIVKQQIGNNYNKRIYGG